MSLLINKHSIHQVHKSSYKDPKHLMTEEEGAGLYTNLYVLPRSFTDFTSFFVATLQLSDPKNREKKLYFV